MSLSLISCQNLSQDFIHVTLKSLLTDGMSISEKMVTILIIKYLCTNYYFILFIIEKVDTAFIETLLARIQL